MMRRDAGRRPEHEAEETPRNETLDGEERVDQDEGVFYLDTSTDRLSDALFRYGRALTRIYDLTLHSP